MKAKHAIKSWMYVTLALFKDKMKIESHYKKQKKNRKIKQKGMEDCLSNLKYCFCFILSGLIKIDF